MFQRTTSFIGRASGGAFFMYFFVSSYALRRKPMPCFHASAPGRAAERPSSPRSVACSTPRASIAVSTNGVRCAVHASPRFAARRPACRSALSVST
jgi:hypothetical protein